MFKKIPLTYFILNITACLTFFYLASGVKLVNLHKSSLYLGGTVALLLLYFLSGTFVEIRKKSRFKELVTSLNQSLLLAFILLFYHYFYNDKPSNSWPLFIIKLAALHFVILAFFRLCYLTAIKKLIQNKKLGFNTLIIGSKINAKNIIDEINQQKKSLGFKIVGFFNIDAKETITQQFDLPELGKNSTLQQVITEHKIEEVIIAIETSQHLLLKSLLDELEDCNIIVHLIPDVYDIVSGFVKINYLFSIPLITLYQQFMPFWQRVIKTIVDYFLSIVILIILSPLYIIIALFIKLGGGPVIYPQERIGKNGRPFMIYKFRTMVTNAERNGPMLSSFNDPRVTKIGLFLRRLRLDELPQFINVLKGEMSIVGPRPERQFYINKIIEKAPHYQQLQKVLPGITSWGQVKFGYAENVEQMVKRLTFDIIYIQNRSLALDFKIMIYTLLIMAQRRGK